MLRAPFVLIFNILSLVAYLWSSFWFHLGYFFRRKNKLYIQLKLHNNYPFGPLQGLAKYFKSQPSFLELRESLKHLAEDPHIAGIILTAEPNAMGSGQRRELLRLLDAARDSGKHIVAHTQMPMTNDYLILTAADDILVTPSGRLYTFGPRIEQLFAHQALERLGVLPQFIHIGEFKTASHRFIHDEMTQAQHLMMSGLLRDLKELTLERIQARRNLSRDQAEELFAHAPLDTAQARRLGFIDAELFQGMLGSWVEEGPRVTQLGLIQQKDEASQDSSKSPEKDRHAIYNTPDHPKNDVRDEKNQNFQVESAQQIPPQTVNSRKPRAAQSQIKKSKPVDPPDHQTLLMKSDDYLNGHPGKYQWRPLFRRPQQFAVLDLSGMIVMPNMNMPGQGAVAIDPQEVLPALDKIRANPRLAGAILHINSPGGSALASDIIWQAIDRVRQEKPVIAQCSDVVGSGGYYLAAGCDEIICERSTITGSIGVITGKMTAPEVPQKFGVHIETLFEHDADNFTSLTHPLSPEMMARMDGDARAFYRRFLERVGQARGLNRRRLHRYARGRVYLAEAAQKRGLVDHIGGIDLAIERLASLCNLDAETTELRFISHRKESLKGALRGSLFQTAAGPDPAASSAHWALKSGAQWLETLAEPALIAQLLRRDPILAIMPMRVR